MLGGRDIECFCLLNTDCQFSTSINVLEGKVMLVIIFRDNYNGLKYHIFHLCSQPFHILPVKSIDQLWNAAIKIITTKPMKTLTSLTEYQMNKQREKFNGINTCSIKSNVIFNFVPKPSSEIEARYICN